MFTLFGSDRRAGFHIEVYTPDFIICPTTHKYQIVLADIGEHGSKGWNGIVTHDDNRIRTDLFPYIRFGYS
jgi:hypothetical protein